MFILKAENTEKAGHKVKPCPGKMCTLTSVVRSQHATGQTMRICIPRTSISEYNKAFRASWCVHSAHGLHGVLQNTLVYSYIIYIVDLRVTSLAAINIDVSQSLIGCTMQTIKNYLFSKQINHALC